MKKIKYKLCKAILERFKATTEKWFIGSRMEPIRIIRRRDIADLCALFKVDFWSMYCDIHRNYMIRFN